MKWSGERTNKKRKSFYNANTTNKERKRDGKRQKQRSIPTQTPTNKTIAIQTSQQSKTTKKTHTETQEKRDKEEGRKAEEKRKR